MDEKLESWEITAKRYVGFIDIMGFKDWVAREDHDAIYKLMKTVSESIRTTQGIFGIPNDTENVEYVENIYITTFSDSIVIFSKNGDVDSLENFIGAISTLSSDLFRYRIPHKGAIAFGKMTVDFQDLIFFGQPLIDAYLLEEELTFYGIAVHSTAEFLNDLIADENVIEYLCPFKTAIANHLTITPAITVSDEFDEDEFEKLEASVIALKEKTSGALRKYIDNTLKYLQYVKTKAKEVIAEEEEKES